jgi:hypothetical protein
MSSSNDPMSAEETPDSEAPTANSGQRHQTSPDKAMRITIPYDQPRQSSGDLPTENDHLGFKPYVQAVAEFLADRNTEPPLTFSIEGDWGCGKSSFMKQLASQPEKRASAERFKQRKSRKKKSTSVPNWMRNPFVPKPIVVVCRLCL